MAMTLETLDKVIQKLLDSQKKCFHEEIPSE